MLKIKCFDKTYDVKEGTILKDALNDVMPINSIAARFNNDIASLNQPLEKDGTVTFIDRTTKDGREIYIRGLLYVVSMAVESIYPGSKFNINYQLSNSMYCTFKDREITDELIEAIKNKTDEIIEKDIPIIKKEMTPAEADEFYKKEDDSVRGKLQLAVNKDKVSLYFCDDYYNYFYGTMPISTGFIELYDIVKYDKGLLIKYPSFAEPNIIKRQAKSLKLASALKEYDEINKLMGLDTVYKLNKKIDAGEEKEIILCSESLHEKKMSELSNKIKQKGNVKLVLIAGPSSSAKTTFARKLGMYLRVNGLKPNTISVDNYFVEREQNPVDENGNYDFENIDALDLDLLNTQILDLLKGKEVSLPTFNFKTGHKEYLGNKMKLNDDEIIIMEGIHCLNKKLTALIPDECKYKIYISDLTVLNVDYYNRISTTDTRLLRRIVRDYKFRNYTALHTLKMWYSVNRGENKNIFPYQEQADYMFNSSIVYELSALKKYAEPLLEEISDTEPEFSEAKRLLSLLKYFEPINNEDLIPNDSLIREFIGGSVFED